jgi:predicted alpha/beta superfamily hydrolase
MKNLFLILTVFFCFDAKAQITTENIESTFLGKVRTIDLYVPELGSESIDPMPLIVVLEGNDLFNLTVSNVKFLSKIGYMPKSIVVGIHQEGSTQVKRDSEINKNSGQLSSRGSNFKQFITSDIVQRLQTLYNISNLKVIIGKNKLGNFINFFLLDNNPIFSAYIAITPELTGSIIDPIIAKTTTVKKDISYYLSNSENLPKRQKNNTSILSDELKKIENPKFHLTNNLFADPDEFSSPIYSIPVALENIFRVYQPISPKVYKEKILKESQPPHVFLINKYQRIYRELGIQKKYILNDVMAVFAAAQKKADAESLFVLGELALQDYPTTMMGYYFNGLGYEILENYKKALKNYESAYTLEPIDFITKELVLNKIELLK